MEHDLFGEPVSSRGSRPRAGFFRIMLFDRLFVVCSAPSVIRAPIDPHPRWRLVRDAFELMVPGAPFVQFTYSVASPLPRRLGGFTAEASERIWMNIPPARVWVYRKSGDR